MINNLTVECEEVVCTSTVKRGQDTAHIKMSLINVHMDELMQQLINEAGVQSILDYLSDTDIEHYLKGTK